MKNRSGKIPRSSEFHVLSTDFPRDLVFLIEWARARTLPNGNSRERSLKRKIACSFALEDSPSRRLWPGGATTFPTVIHNDILPLCDLQAANKNKCVTRCAAIEARESLVANVLAACLLKTYGMYNERYAHILAKATARHFNDTNIDSMRYDLQVNIVA